MLTYRWIIIKFYIFIISLFVAAFQVFIFTEPSDFIRNNIQIMYRIDKFVKKNIILNVHVTETQLNIIGN